MTTSHRFVAFSTIDGAALAYGETAGHAITTSINELSTADFVEVVDCRDFGKAIVDNAVSLGHARKMGESVFRGKGYDRV